MSRRAIANAIDDALRPAGFSRRNLTWTRRSSPLVDVIDLQLSKSHDQATVNVGVLYPDVYLGLWGRDAGQFPQEPHCTVRARIGFLQGGRDRWWAISAPEAPIEIASCVSALALPFCAVMHSPDAVVDWLAVPTRRRSIPEGGYLALFLAQQGNFSEAHSVLEILLQRSVSSVWKETLRQIIDQVRLSSN